MDITFVTNTDSDSQALELFLALGFPFQEKTLKNNRKNDNLTLSESNKEKKSDVSEENEDKNDNKIEN